MFASRQSDGAQRLNLRSARRAQRAALHRHRVHHPARTRIRLRASRHCHRNPAADADRHQVGQPRLPLPDDLDKPTGRALHLARTRRIASADQRIVLLARDCCCTRPGCTVAGANCQVHHAVSDWPTTAKPMSMTSPSRVPEITAASNPAAGARENAKTAAPNGSHHHTRIQARVGSTTTTTPKTPTTRRRRRVMAHRYARPVAITIGW